MAGFDQLSSLAAASAEAATELAAAQAALVQSLLDVGDALSALPASSGASFPPPPPLPPPPPPVQPRCAVLPDKELGIFEFDPDEFDGVPHPPPPPAPPVAPPPPPSVGAGSRKLLRGGGGGGSSTRRDADNGAEGPVTASSVEYSGYAFQLGALPPCGCILARTRWWRTPTTDAAPLAAALRQPAPYRRA